MRRILSMSALLLSGGCSTMSYYAQSIGGQIGLMAASRPIEDVLAEPHIAEPVRLRLEQLPAVRRFAVEALGLQASDSYTLYADVRREALVWSVTAAPFASLQPREWCYPFVGCATYRGYFNPETARAYAATLAGQGWDVAVEPVPAYSTLGWFSDPLPSTVAHWPMSDIAGLVFHEMAHETLYVPGDSAFNEGYATLVEREGVRRWQGHHAGPRQRREHLRRERRRADFLQLLAVTRQRLEEIFASGYAHDEVGVRKRAVFASLRDEYRVLRRRWGGYAGYDQWFERPLNNAHLAAAATYNALQPAFQAILDTHGGDLPAFHAACRGIAAMGRAERTAYMTDLLRGGAPARPASNPVAIRRAAVSVD